MPDPIAPLTSALAERYRIERELGEGGMANVYLAEDVKHERQVAVKALKPELAASVGTDRFLREVRTTANLRHPHIVPLYDSGEAGGFLFYVMPFIEGSPPRRPAVRRVGAEAERRREPVTAVSVRFWLSAASCR